MTRNPMRNALYLGQKANNSMRNTASNFISHTDM